MPFTFSCEMENIAKGAKTPVAMLMGKTQTNNVLPHTFRAIANAIFEVNIVLGKHFANNRTISTVAL